MKIKLTRHLLVTSNVVPSRRDSIVDVEDGRAKELLKAGYAVEPTEKEIADAEKRAKADAKAAPVHANKAAGPTDNKAAGTGDDKTPAATRAAGSSAKA